MEKCYTPEHFHDLFVVLGSSAAALIGLLFIATSLHLSDVVNNETLHRRAYNNTCYLLIVLVEALMMLLPQPLILLGAEVVAINLAGISLLYRFVSAFFTDRAKYRAAGGQPYIAVIFLLCFALGIVDGLVLVTARDWGAYLLIASCIILMVRVVLSAWIIMVRIGALAK